MRVTARIALALLIVLGLVGCDPGANGDAGADAAMDARVRADARVRGDAGVVDAGAPGDASGSDAGGPDAGPEPCSPSRPDVSSPPPGASWRYGGGDGYPDIVYPDGPCAAPGTTRVRTLAELTAALAAASPGDVVYVDDDVEIDLTGTSVDLGAGVTLASGRGRAGSAGARLFSTSTEARVMIRVRGDDARVAGLRIHGPDPSLCPPEYAAGTCPRPDRTGGVNCRDCTLTSDGIQAYDVSRLEVDNCEVAGFGFGGVRLQNGVGHHVHHSFLHHNQREGLGYGVVLTRHASPTEVVIEHNRFDYQRHAVAGSGEREQSYDARFNLTLTHANGHVFDMHGQNEGTNDGTPWAGRRMRIHDNTVLPNVYAAVIRGRPSEHAWIYDNCLARSSASTAVLQRFYTGNLTLDEDPSGAAAPNRYGQSATDCEAVRFCAQLGGRGPLRYLAPSSLSLADVGVGDFDGDGRADLFRATGTEWQWRDQGRGAWTRLNTSSYRLSALAFADVDGDGRADVLRSDGATWYASMSGSGSWTTLRAASEPLAALAFADFDGDGRADAFEADGTQWRVSDGATGAWRALRTDATPMSALGFGDFDGDGRTDVLRTSGGRWEVSDGGTSAWRRLNSSGITLGSLGLADVTGDGRTDVLSRQGDRWFVSESGETGWRAWSVDSRAVGSARFADFDGDGRDDALEAGCL